MVKNKNARYALLFIALVACYFGFTFVTQAGQGLNAVQNDGYGGTGGLLLLTSGFIFGLLVERNKSGKK
jgi:uncharacterized membrane protein